MKINKLLLINFLIILYLEILFKCVVFKNLFSFNSLYLIPFSFFCALIITLILRAVPDKISKILIHIIWLAVSLIFISEYVYFAFYNTVVGLDGLEYTSQVMTFKSSILQVFLGHLHFIILFLFPNITLFLIRKILKFDKIKLKEFFILIIILMGVLLITFSSFFIKGNNSLKIMFKKNNILLSSSKFGLISALNLDLIKYVFDFEEQAVIINVKEEEVIENVNYNITEIDFDSIINNEKSNNLKVMHNYFKSVLPTKQNEYTGMFKGKNLIFIIAEAFYPMAIDKELTPTLYKLQNEGFNFTNFYQPIYGCSTSDGEFTSLYSLLPGAATCTMKVTQDNYYPYSLGKVFDYNAYAFHAGSYKYYSRHKTLPNLGFSYYACGNGLNINCKSWPQSDVEMVQDSLKYYINDNNFVAYYMSISGHLEYNFYGNLIAKKNKTLVSDLKTTEPIKAYMATQIEFDRSLELLLAELKKSGKLDDTVIAIVPDHYPYGLDDREITNYTGIHDMNFELYKNAFILWNSEIDKSVVIDKYASNIDVLPTILNLFGIEYDSRLLIGKDILSDSDGIVMFNNFNWINDYGKYNYATNTFTANGKNVLSDSEIDEINASIQNKFTMSKLIVLEDYYRTLFKED